MREVYSPCDDHLGRIAVLLPTELGQPLQHSLIAKCSLPCHVIYGCRQLGHWGTCLGVGDAVAGLTAYAGLLLGRITVGLMTAETQLARARARSLIARSPASYSLRFRESPKHQNLLSTSINSFHVNQTSICRAGGQCLWIPNMGNIRVILELRLESSNGLRATRSGNVFRSPARLPKDRQPCAHKNRAHDEQEQNCAQRTKRR